MHPEVLNEKIRAVWNKCGFLRDFYLAGGTALALQIGHRISVDLDFFSNNPLRKTLLTEIEEVFGPANVLVNGKNELTAIVSEVKLTFLHYPFALLSPTLPTAIAPVASLKDIASMKAYTLGRRRSLKDYVDLYFIFSMNLSSLTQVIEDSRRKYGELFNDRFFLEQLLSPEDLEEEEINWIQNKVSKGEIKDFFSALIRQSLAP